MVIFRMCQNIGDDAPTFSHLSFEILRHIVATLQRTLLESTTSELSQIKMVRNFKWILEGRSFALIDVNFTCDWLYLGAADGKRGKGL